MLKYGRTFDPVCNAAMESFRLCLNVNAIVDGGMELDRKGKGWIAFRLLFESRP